MQHLGMWDLLTRGWLEGLSMNSETCARGNARCVCKGLCMRASTGEHVGGCTCRSTAEDAEGKYRICITCASIVGVERVKGADHAWWPDSLISGTNMESFTRSKAISKEHGTCGLHQENQGRSWDWDSYLVTEFVRL